jgi:hypothetical protein
VNVCVEAKILHVFLDAEMIKSELVGLAVKYNLWLVVG